MKNEKLQWDISIQSIIHKELYTFQFSIQLYAIPM